MAPTTLLQIANFFTLSVNVLVTLALILVVFAVRAYRAGSVKVESNDLTLCIECVFSVLSFVSGLKIFLMTFLFANLSLGRLMGLLTSLPDSAFAALPDARTDIETLQGLQSVLEGGDISIIVIVAAVTCLFVGILQIFTLLVVRTKPG